MNSLKNKNTHSVRVLIILGAILLLQCLMLVYWQGQRGNFCVDELYSFGYASSFTSNSSHYITDSPEWKFDEWMDSDDLTGQLRVEKSERLNSLPLTDQIHLFLQKRAYFGMMNLIMSASGYGSTFYQYAWRILILNLQLFLIAELLLAYCVRKITGNEEVMILSVLMFGSCAVIMGIAGYVRFYILAIALLLAVLCTHLKLWDEENLYLCLAWEVTGFVCAYYGLIHSEFMFVTCGVFFCLYFTALLCRKRWRQAVIYAAPLLFGLFYFVNRRTRLLRAFLHPDQFAEPTSGLPGATYKYLTWTPERGRETLKDIFFVFRDKWFGSDVILAAFMILLIIGAIYLIAERRIQTDNKTQNNGYSGFIVIVFITALTSLVFNDLADFKADRYQSFIITLLIIVLWACIGAVSNSKKGKYFLITAAILTIACAVVSQRPEKLPFLYIDENPVKAALEYYTHDDYVLFTYKGDRHATYDCVSHAGKNTRLFVNDPEKEASLKNVRDIPDEFVAWGARAADPERMQQALDEIGYNYELIGSTHENDIYICTEK